MIAPGVVLAPNFLASEFIDASAGAWPNSVNVNTQALANHLQVIRRLRGNRPLVITDYYRPGDDGQHGNGSAVDFRDPERDPMAAGAVIVAAQRRGELPDFGQLILYPHTDQHVHYSLANRASGKKNEVLVKVKNGYAAWQPGDPVPAWSGGTVGIPDAPANESGTTRTNTLAWLLVALVMAALLFWGTR
jgi:hypothetical protein